MNFASDNVYGVHPRILAALNKVNAGTAPSYGSDDLSKRTEERLSEIFEREVRAFLVTTGEHFQKAWELNDLVLGTPEDDVVWRAIRDMQTGPDDEDGG